MLRTTNPTRPVSLDELLDAALAARLGGVDIASRRTLMGKMKGERRSKRRGDSVEFADHRQYSVGDDLRRVDWNIFGRLDRLFMKLYLEEEDITVHVILDASASMDCGEPGKFLFAQRLAAALAYVGLSNLHRVGLSAIGGTLEERPANGESGAQPDTAPSAPDRAAPGEAPLHNLRDLRGRSRIHDAGRWLCALRPGDVGSGASRFGEACKRIALARRGKGIVVVISDFMLKEGYESGLRVLAGRGHDVFAIQVLSPQELEPTLGGDLRLRDVEDGDAPEVTISAPLLARYKANLRAYIDALRLFCAQRGIVHLSVRSDASIESLTLEHLRARGLLE